MTIKNIRRSALRALIPPPKLSTVEWIEKHIHLPSSASALPGRMKLWPYQRGWCDAIDDPEIERVTILKSARVGYSAWLNAIIGATVANNPCPIALLMPTENDARDVAVEMESLFENSPELRGLLSDENDPSGRSTLLAKRFAGGSLRFLAARSPRNLRRHTIRILCQDEIDGFEVTQEGDPIKLAEMRTLTFRDRKILAGSTPVFDHGPISRLYSESDQRIYEVPCPQCGEHSEIRWSDIKWNNGDPNSAHWVCPKNGCVVDERHKPEMVARGRWRATKPEVKGHAGFRINSLISPHANASWPKLVAEFLNAKKSPETLRPYLNTVLGEPWRDDGEDFDEGALLARREPFSLDRLPQKILWLSAGIDCQDDRLECVVLGHAETDWYVLAHEVFWGPIGGDEVWQELDDYLKKTWQHPRGGRIGISACAIDAGDGGHIEIVQGFTRPRSARRIIAIKGVSGFSRVIFEKSKGKQALWLVGVDAAKSRLFDRIGRGEGIHFSDELQPVFFEQLCSERRVVRYRHGRPVMNFERIRGRRAETLDATVYALAVRGLINRPIEARENELSSRAAPKPASNLIKSAWLGDRSNWF